MDTQAVSGTSCRSHSGASPQRGDEDRIDEVRTALGNRFIVGDDFEERCAGLVGDSESVRGTSVTVASEWRVLAAVHRTAPLWRESSCASESY